MFQVGKKVICIKDHSQGLVKKGDVFPLFGIKKGCCGSCKLMLDIGKVNDKAAMECPNCNYFFITDVLWIDSNLFAPYDDELSDVSLEELIDELFPSLKPQPVSHILQNEFERLKQLLQTYNESADLSHDNGRYDLMTSYVMEIQAVNDAMADFTDLFTLNRDN